MLMSLIFLPHRDMCIEAAGRYVYLFFSGLLLASLIFLQLPQGSHGFTRKYAQAKNLFDSSHAQFLGKRGL